MVIFKNLKALARKALCHALIFAMLNLNCPWALANLEFQEEELLMPTKGHTQTGGLKLNPGVFRNGSLHTVLDTLEIGTEGQLTLGTLEEAHTAYTRIYDENPVILAELLASATPILNIIANSGGLQLKGTRFANMHNLVLGAGYIRQSNCGVACEVNQAEILLQQIKSSQNLDLQALAILSGRFQLKESELSLSDNFSVTVGKHIHGVDPTVKRWVQTQSSTSNLQELVESIFIDSATTLKAKTIHLESLDEGATINCRGFLEATDGDIVIQAKGDVHIDHLKAKGNLRIFTTGKVTFGDDVFVGGHTRIKGYDVKLGQWSSDGAVFVEAINDLWTGGTLWFNNKATLFGRNSVILEGDIQSSDNLSIASKGVVDQRQTIETTGFLKIKGKNIRKAGRIKCDHYLIMNAEEDIRLVREGISTPSWIKLQSKTGKIHNDVELIGDQFITFEAHETTNLKKVSTKGSLNTKGEFKNRRSGEVQAGMVSDLDALLQHNTGHIHLLSDIAWDTEKILKQGQLTTDGFLRFQGPKLTVNSGAQLVANRGALFAGGGFENNGSFSAYGVGLTGKLSKFTGTGKSELYALVAEVDSWDTPATSIVRTQTHFDIQGENYTHRGILFTQGVHRISVKETYHDDGTTYSPNLFVVKANTIGYGQHHQAYFTDALITAKEDVDVASGATFNFYGPQYYLDVFGQNVTFSGQVTHQSSDSFPFLQYHDALGEIHPMDAVQKIKQAAFALRDIDWLKHKGSFSSQLNLRAKNTLTCSGASILPENGSLNLIADGNINTNGANIRSGYFEGNHLTARGRYVTLDNTQLNSMLGQAVVQGDTQARLNSSTLHGGANAFVRGESVKASQSEVKSTYGTSHALAECELDLRDTILSGLEGTHVTSGDSGAIHNSRFAGRNNCLQMPSGEVIGCNFTGRSSLQGDSWILENFANEGRLAVRAKDLTLSGYGQGGDLFALSDRLHNAARLATTNIHLEATEIYTDTEATRNEAAKDFTLYAPKTGSFKGTNIAGDTATYKLPMDLFDLLGHTTAPRVVADLMETDVHFKTPYFIDPHLTLFARNLTNDTNLTTQGDFTAYLSGHMQNNKFIGIGGDGFFRADEGINTHSITAAGKLGFETVKIFDIQGLLEGEAVSAVAGGINCERAVKRTCIEGGYCDVLEHPVGIHGRNGDVLVDAKSFLQARNAEFIAKGGRLWISAPSFYIGSQVTEEEVSWTHGKHSHHHHYLTHHKSVLEGDLGIDLLSRASEISLDIRPVMILEGVDASSLFKYFHAYSEGELHNLDVHNQRSEIDTSSSKKRGVTGTKKTTKKVEQFSDTVVSNFTKAAEEVVYESEDANHQWAPIIHSGSNVRIKSFKGDVFMHADKSVSYSSMEKKSKSAAWFSIKQKGHIHELAQIAQIIAKDGTEISGANIHVDVIGSELQSAISKHLQTPEMSWIHDLRGNPNINWQLVSEEHKKWSKKVEGLTPAASAVLGLAVAIATAGSGAAAGFAGMVGCAKGTLAATMTAAGFTSLVSQASVSLISNKGNIGKTLKDLGSKQAIQSLATAVISAGLVYGASDALNLPMNVTDAQTFAEHLQVNAVRSAVDAGLDMTIGQQDPGEALLQGLRSLAAGTIGGVVANQFAEARSSMGFVGHKLAHGVLGAATGVISSDDFRSGALSGAFGAMAAETVAELAIDREQAQREVFQEALQEGRPLSQEQFHQRYREKLRPYTDLVRVGTGAAALFAGLDPSISISTATNALDNNFLWLLFGAGAAGGTTVVGGGTVVAGGAAAAGAGSGVATAVTGLSIGMALGIAATEVMNSGTDNGKTTMDAVPTDLPRDEGFTQSPSQPSVFSTPTSDYRTSDQGFNAWTTGPVTFSTPIPTDLPDMMVLWNSSGKTYQTYIKYNPVTGETYVGRTSGFELPELNIWKRNQSHHMNEKGFKPAILDVTSSNESAIRGREQLKIEELGGAKSKGGTSGNSINSISDKNPKKDHYVDQAKKEFGGE